MKTKTTLLLILVALAALTGCKKDKEKSDEETPPPACVSGGMSITFDGATWQHISLTGKISVTSMDDTHVLKTLNIDAQNSKGDIFTIALNNYALKTSDNCIENKDYTDQTNDLGRCVMYKSDMTPLYNPESGTIKITSCNSATKQISGTFNYVLYDVMNEIVKKTISGTFTDVCYTVYQY